MQRLFDKFKQILNKFIIDSKIDKNDKYEIILIGGSILIPKIREIITEIFNNSNINDKLEPKEVVAMGAAIKAGKINKLSSVKDITLFDVTNLSLGVNILGNKFAVLLKRSSKIPIDNKDIFFTVEDNQTTADIEVYEGESFEECNKNNLLLGKFEISNLPKKKAGEAKIEIKLEIKEKSILIVTATDISNPGNYKILPIEKQINFEKIMNDLILRENSFKFIENDLYNEIKFSIIE